MLRSRTRTDTPTLTSTEVVSSKALTVSIAEMTIGVAPSMVATTTTRQSAAAPVSTTTVSAGRSIATPVGTADTATMVAHSVVQMATGSPYPPGFPYLPAGYPPYWGMYPYPYPQYVPPMPTMPLGGNPALMNATLPTSAAGLCPSQAALEPPVQASGATLGPHRQSGRPRIRQPPPIEKCHP